MKPFLKGLIVGVAATLAIGGIAGVAALKLVWDGGRQVVGALAKHEEASATDAKQIPAAGLEQLVVRTGAGDIELREGDGPAIRIEARRVARGKTHEEAASALAQLQWHAERQGGVLTIEQADRKASAKQHYELKALVTAQSRSVHFTVILPRGSRLAADLSTGTGDIRVHKLGADATVDTGVGNLTLHDITGALTAHAGTGDIAVTGGRGPLKANTGIGEIRAEGREGAMALTAGTGDLVLKPKAVTGPITADTSMGEIRFVVPASADCRIETHRGMGELVNESGAKPEAGRDEEDAAFVFGRGAQRVKLSAGMGDLRLQKAE